MLFLAIHQGGFGLVSRHKFWLNFPSRLRAFVRRAQLSFRCGDCGNVSSSSSTIDDAYCFPGYNLKAPGTWQIELVPALSITLHLGWRSKVLPFGLVVTREQSFCNIVISSAGWFLLSFYRVWVI